ncbi:hypothetical protein G6F58_010872 [Rhizopus delemar]|nr:hypothetical protein G6F58_010872 [Rhizopus delemar]
MLPNNDMINGTKLLNVTGMSRGKRDGILKNEKGRVVVKVGAMHLKGVWVTFARAKALAIQYSIIDYLYPLFVDDPNSYFYPKQLPQNNNYFMPNHQPIYLQTQEQPINYHPYHPHHQQHTTTAMVTTNPYPNNMTNEHLMNYYNNQDYFMNELPSAPSVPSMLPIEQYHNYYS